MGVDQLVDGLQLAEDETVTLSEPLLFLYQLFENLFADELVQLSLLTFDPIGCTDLEERQNSDSNALSMRLVVLNSKHLLSPSVVTYHAFFLLPLLGRTPMIPHLHGIRKRYPQSFVNLHSGTAILREQLIDIATIHLIGREVAPVVPEAFTLSRQYLRVELVLHLLLNLIQPVSVNEGPFVWVGM